MESQPMVCWPFRPILEPSLSDLDILKPLESSSLTTKLTHRPLNQEGCYKAPGFRITDHRTALEPPNGHPWGAWNFVRFTLKPKPTLTDVVQELAQNSTRCQDVMTRRGRWTELSLKTSSGNI